MLEKLCLYFYYLVVFALKIAHIQFLAILLYKINKSFYINKYFSICLNSPFDNSD